MRDEHMLMYALVFVLGFMVARMMGCRLVEGEDLCYTANFDKGQCKGQIMEEELRHNTFGVAADKAYHAKLTNCETVFSQSRCLDNEIAARNGKNTADLSGFY